MRAVVYPRVSGAAQRERDTIASQLRVLPAFVEREQWELVRSVDTYVDDGHTAKSGHLDQRRGLTKLLADAASGVFDVVVVVSIDRLTRSEDLTERGAILGAFQRAGVKIADATSGQILDLSTSAGDLFSGLQAFFAAEENRKRRERVLQGKLSAAIRGAKTTGRDPYGLRYDKPSHTWSIDKVRGPIVIEIYERAAAGESCSAIAFDLEVRGLPAPGARWAKGRVRDLLRSRHPAGEFIAHRKSRTAVAVPAIVTEELWQAAQDALEYAHKRGLTKRTRHTYLLENLAVCHCGAPMRIRSAYTTRGRWRRPAAYYCGGGCGAKPVHTAVADERAWSAIARKIEDPGIVAELSKMTKATAADASTWKGDATAARAHIARLDSVQETVMTRFRRGMITEAGLDKELVAIRRERAQASAQLRMAERARGKTIGAQTRAREASVSIDRLRAAMSAADPVERAGIIVTLVDVGGVRFDGGEIHVNLFIPIGVSAREDSAALATAQS